MRNIPPTVVSAAKSTDVTPDGNESPTLEITKVDDVETSLGAEIDPRAGKFAHCSATTVESCGSAIVASAG
jgi:hypothetical protein